MGYDVVVFGGGISAYWLVDELRRAGKSVCLLDTSSLSAPTGEYNFSQTLASQGIIHGGLKYSLTGILSDSAKSIREMPHRWLGSLKGQCEPDLSAVKWRAPGCYLWRTQSLSSQFGMFGAKIGLRTKPLAVPRKDIPPLLRNSSGDVYFVEETVISPQSLLKEFLKRNRDSCFALPENPHITFQETTSHSTTTGMQIEIISAMQRTSITAGIVVFAAGEGNAILRSQAGKTTEKMQKRPLRMLMLKGDLPDFCGHCVDGAKTRVTITSERISSSETVWQIGGNLAEKGPGMTEQDFLALGLSEVHATIPDLNLEKLVCSSYLVNRAEGKTSMGGRPDMPVILTENRIITCWPTKLALVPLAITKIMQEIHSLCSRTSAIIQHSPNLSSAEQSTKVMSWEKPTIAPYPWELSLSTTWHHTKDVLNGQVDSTQVDTRQRKLDTEAA